MVDGGTGKKWRGFAADPRLVACKEERRQWVAALTAWHMENTRLLVTGCHYYPLRGTEFWCLYTRHVDVSGQRVGGHSEPSPKRRQKARQRMRDDRAVNVTPLAA